MITGRRKLPGLCFGGKQAGERGPMEGKYSLRNERKNIKNFVIFSEIMLDKCIQGWYTVLARVGGICEFFPEHKSAMR